MIRLGRHHGARGEGVVLGESKLVVYAPGELTNRDYYWVGRYSAVGWLLHQVLGVKAVDLLDRARVREEERRLARLLGVSRADLMYFEWRVDRAPAGGRPGLWAAWCLARGLEVKWRAKRGEGLGSRV